MRWWQALVMPASTHIRLAQADTWLLEMFLGAYTLVWGLNLVNPLTDAFGNNPRSFALLSGFPGGEVALGTLSSLGGGLTIWAALGGTRQTRAVTAGLVGMFWLIIAVAIGVPTGWAGGGVVVLVALSHWFCWVRLSHRGHWRHRP